MNALELYGQSAAQVRAAQPINSTIAFVSSHSNNEDEVNVGQRHTQTSNGKNTAPPHPLPAELHRMKQHRQTEKNTKGNARPLVRNIVVGSGMEAIEGLAADVKIAISGRHGED